MKASRVLIIASDRILIDELSAFLVAQEAVVVRCRDGQKGLQQALNSQFDIILLDIALPTIDGFVVITHLRVLSQIPVMMFSLCESESERIAAYSKGADDYLSKGLSLIECQLRLKSLLRRTSMLINDKPKDKVGPSYVLQVDDLQLTRRNKRVIYAETPIVLTAIQFRLLWVLVENRNEVLSKAYLYQAVLERAFSRYDRSLDMHLSRVRKKLTDAGMPTERFCTIHGKGYRFT